VNLDLADFSDRAHRVGVRVMGSLGEVAAVGTAAAKSRFLAQSVIVNQISTGAIWLPSTLQVRGGSLGAPGSCELLPYVKQ
jgi:hypothetical protein